MIEFKESFEAKGTILRESAAALLLKTHDSAGDEVTVWIPFSQVVSISRGDGGDTVVMSKWIAEKKELY